MTKVTNVTHRDSFHTSQRTGCVFIAKTTHLILYREITTVYCHNHVEHIYTVWAACRILCSKFGDVYRNYWTC